ncbi:unnamed protein product [Schistosoma mattheei]|uniref:Uncharacterized protein n=1 Tax=Schistosoma mattheei TaxID=31246 RepID=A0A183P3N2_9TREM|nr:unnamed protein product [Schistosoma mattheei]
MIVEKFGSLKPHIQINTNMLQILSRKIWEGEQMPLTDWKEGHLTNTPMKDLRCENYRGITLLLVPGKVFNSVAEPDERFEEDLDFTDDLTLQSHTHEQMQVKRTSVAAATASVGLNISKGKTKILKFNTENNQPNHIRWRNSGRGADFHVPGGSASSMDKDDPMKT